MGNQKGPEIGEGEFVAIYGTTEFKRGVFTLTLNKALELEAKRCPVPEAERQDPDARLGYMAKMIGADALMPEHQYLLEQTPDFE